MEQNVRAAVKLQFKWRICVHAWLNSYMRSKLQTVSCYVCIISSSDWHVLQCCSVIIIIKHINSLLSLYCLDGLPRVTAYQHTHRREQQRFSDCSSECQCLRTRAALCQRDTRCKYALLTRSWEHIDVKFVGRELTTATEGLNLFGAAHFTLHYYCCQKGWAQTTETNLWPKQKRVLSWATRNDFQILDCSSYQNQRPSYWVQWEISVQCWLITAVSQCDFWDIFHVYYTPSVTNAVTLGSTHLLPQPQTHSVLDILLERS